MNLKKKIFYVLLCLLAVIVMMPIAEAKTIGWYKKKNGTCAQYPDMSGFCVQPGVTYRSSANYKTCDISLTCYEAAAAWQGKQYENTNSFWAAQTVLNGRKFYTNSSCSGSAEISIESVSKAATDYCTLPKFGENGATEFNMKVGDDPLTITDVNGVLSDYTIYYTSPAIKATKSGNKIIIEALSTYNKAEILIYKGSKTAVTGMCSSNSQNLVKVTAAPYISTKIYVNVAKAEEVSSTEPEPQEVVKYGTLKILKVDENDTPIENVRFKLGTNLNGVENQDYVIRYTNSEGIITYNNIVAGSSFYYQEISVPDGYTISDSRVKYIYIGENTYEVKVIDFVDQTKGAIKVIKTDEYGEPIQGVKFKIGTNILGREADDEWHIYTTDKYGQILIPGLDEGTYQVKEVEGVEGYIFNEDEAYTYTLVINEEQNYDEIVIKNRKNVERQLRILKVSKEDGKALPNVRINVYNEDGSKYHEGITDEFGSIVIDDIEYGKYFIEEVEAPTGYKKMEEPITFEITEEEPIREFTIENELINSKTGELNLTIGFVAILLVSGATYLVLKKREKLV